MSENTGSTGTVTCSARSDVGLKRAVNEDSLLLGPPVWAVADGMGGHAAGDVASAIVVETLQRTLTGLRGSLRPTDIKDALRNANQRILAHQVDHPTTAGMGSTVAGLAQITVGSAPHWAIFNVGDSRVYRCQQGQMARATVDHSETEELICAGQITPEEGRSHSRRNVITRSLGSDPAPQVDMWIRPQVPGERFLICSDGLTTEVDDDRIAQVLTTTGSAEDVVTTLLNLALEHGGRDNISIIIVDMGGDAAAEEHTQPRMRGSEGD
ncbi:MAG: protein phosphatase 2C domain-containing protein [Propionibacteriaceae bacterium]|nr:protein phosphatase 2C domain-containing protein [Propionibacteriaceae bacterium]